MCECGWPLMTSTRETCSDGALTVVSARTCMRVLGDWHRCAGCETSKLVRCAGQLDQLPGDSGLRRLLSSRPVSPAAAGICPLGGARPAPSAHEHPSSGFRAKLSSRKGRRQLLSRGSMASAAHTREIPFVMRSRDCRRSGRQNPSLHGRSSLALRAATESCICDRAQHLRLPQRTRE